MDAKEFIKERKRMCKYYNSKCHDCAVPYQSLCTRSVACIDEKLVDIVEMWSEEHPIKTNFDKALEIMRESFPLVDVTVKNDWKTNTSCFVIREKCGFWDQEYKGDD